MGLCSDSIVTIECLVQVWTSAIKEKRSFSFGGERIQVSALCVNIQVSVTAAELPQE